MAFQNVLPALACVEGRDAGDQIFVGAVGVNASGNFDRIGRAVSAKQGCPIGFPGSHRAFFFNETNGSGQEFRIRNAMCLCSDQDEFLNALRCKGRDFKRAGTSDGTANDDKPVFPNHIERMNRPVPKARATIVERRGVFGQGK